MKELVIISGKGGTGKTSVTASFAALAKNAVLADCDVDAADLHLLLNPQVKETNEFYSGHQAIINEDKCSGCGICMEYCRYDAIKKIEEKGIYSINAFACEGCGVCVKFCPESAIDFPDRFCGRWMVSETKYGLMVHAQLDVAAENSGKLVSTVRREAKLITEKENNELILIDGPPGIGCPVIGSITGTSHVLVVTEPTVSGEHDLLRVLSLVKHFKIPASVCVNKWDLNSDMTNRIEDRAKNAGAKVVGRIRYDDDVTLAQIQKQPVVETDAACAEDIINIWKNIEL